MLANLSPARRRLVVGVLALVLAAVVAGVVVLVVGGDEQNPVAAVPQDELGPVVLVPGYGGTADSLTSLARSLTDDGRDVTIVEPPGGGTGDLRDTATVLDEEVAAALARTGRSSVDIVGYSAGGVVARYWIANGGAHLVRRIVTLSSPQHGSELSDAVATGEILCDKGCRQLVTGSELLAELNAGDETPSGPTWVSIWTTADDTVVPPESAILDGALNMSVQSVCADATPGHGEMPDDALVQAMVGVELAAVDPVELGPDDCDRLSG